MRMKKILFSGAALLTLIFVGCGGEQKSGKADEAVDPQTLVGIYRGELRTPDGTRESVRLQLVDKQNYTMSTEAKAQSSMEERGRYRVVEKTLTLRPDRRGVEKSYKVERGKLIKLDKNDKSEYTLTKD